MANFVMSPKNAVQVLTNESNEHSKQRSDTKPGSHPIFLFVVPIEHMFVAQGRATPLNVFAAAGAPSSALCQVLTCM